MVKNISINQSLKIAILRSLRNLGMPDRKDRKGVIVQEWYEVKLWFSIDVIEKIIKELKYIVRTLPKVKTLTKTNVLIKYYITSWCSLSDVLASIVNKVYELGIDDKDVNIAMVMRNEHIKKTNLIEVMKSYNKKIEYSQYKEIRNDIIHRGNFNHIKELMEIEGIYKSQTFNKLVEVEGGGIDLNSWEDRLKKFNYAYSKVLFTHLSYTVLMINEVFIELESHVKLKIN